MRPSKILRVVRSDERSDEKELAVILHVQPTAATIPLNLSITATDGAEGYGLTVKDSKTRTLKDASSEQTDDEWKAVLRAVLLADAGPEDIQLLKNIQLSALVKKDSISVSIREDVGGIRRRLGVLQLTPQDVEIELWDWLDRVCREKDEAAARTLAAEREAAEARAKLEKLERQIQELSAAKKKHEDALILQFQRLLNEKKKKIRDLSRGQRSEAAVTDNSSRKDVLEEKEEEEEDKEEEAVKGPRKAISKTISGKKRKNDEVKIEEEEDDYDIVSDDGMVVDGDSLEDDSLAYRHPFNNEAEDRQTTDDETLGGSTDDEEL